MKILIIQDEEDLAIDVLAVIKSVKAARRAPKVYLLTDKKYTWELAIGLKVDRVIQKPCNFQELENKLK